MCVRASVCLCGSVRRMRLRLGARVGFGCTNHGGTVHVSVGRYRCLEFTPHVRSRSHSHSHARSHARSLSPRTLLPLCSGLLCEQPVRPHQRRLHERQRHRLRVLVQAGLLPQPLRQHMPAYVPMIAGAHTDTHRHTRMRADLWIGPRRTLHLLMHTHCARVLLRNKGIARCGRCADTRVHARTHTHAHTHARARTHTHPHTHTYLFPPNAAVPQDGCIQGAALCSPNAQCVSLAGGAFTCNCNTGFTGT